MLGLSPRTLQARSGRVATLDLSWRHPSAGGRIAYVKVQVRDGDRRVAEIVVRPRGERMSATGAVALVRRANSLSRAGKTVRAQLGLRIDPSLTGRRLALDVEAADLDGQRQIERGAGAVRVTP